MRVFTLLVLYAFIGVNSEEKFCMEQQTTNDNLADKLLSAAKLSPVYASRHDKEGWLNIFAADAYIEDPVGAPRHYDLGLFYDTFIASHDIKFREREDWIDSERYIVYRHVDIYIEFIDGYGTLVQPAHIIYSFDTELKVSSLKAHWNFAAAYPLISRPLADIGNFMIGSSRAFGRVFVNLGAGFGYEYSKALLSGYFSGGHDCVHKLSDAINEKNRKKLVSMFMSPGTKVDVPGNKTIAAGLLPNKLNEWGISESKVHNLYQSGYVTAARIRFKKYDQNVEAIAFFEILKKRINYMRIFWN